MTLDALIERAQDLEARARRLEAIADWLEADRAWAASARVWREVRDRYQLEFFTTTPEVGQNRISINPCERG